MGRQECKSFWALWLLGTFQSSHAAAGEFPNLAGPPALHGKQSQPPSWVAHGELGGCLARGCAPCCHCRCPLCHPVPRHGHLADHGELLTW